MEEEKRLIRLFVIDNHETIIVSGFHQLFRPTRDFIEITGSAINVRTALQSDHIGRCDIIILDLWIPDEKPVENVRILKENFPNKPILIYSTEDSSEWIRKMIVAGVKGFVNKEAPRHDIKSAIKNIADGGAWFTKSLEQEDLGVISKEIQEHDKALSPVQKKILTLLSIGNSQKEIAKILNTRERNIERTLSTLRSRFNAKTTVELIKILTDKAMI